MNSKPASGPLPHANARKFQQALEYTAAHTGFAAPLVEKDYYCSLVLRDLNLVNRDYLIFKGGTCLCKIHAGFYRLSEDLDFMISVPASLSQNKRRKRIKPMREWLDGLSARLPCFRIEEQMRSHYSAKQYIGRLSYQSVLGGDGEIIVEASLREPALHPPIAGRAETLLLDPGTGSASVGGFPIDALSYDEAYAEKFRAALARKTPAIRDIYDVSIALSAGLDIDNPGFVDLVRMKLAVPENALINLDDDVVKSLKAQLNQCLRPVVKPGNYAQFDVEGTIGRLRRFSEQHGFLSE